MQRLWFHAKRYGYGWYPATWEGWAVLLAFLVLLFLPVASVQVFAPALEEDDRFVFFFLPYAFVLTAILFWICVRTGEKARWRWGGK